MKFWIFFWKFIKIFINAFMQAFTPALECEALASLLKTMIKGDKHLFIKYLR
jgi:hypothetical protein